MRVKRTILALFCMLFFVGCGSGSDAVKQDQPVDLTLSWWGNDSRHEYTINAVKEFEKKHPKIKVTLKYGDWSGFEDRMRMELMSDTEADVMQINYSWLREFSPDGSRFYDIYKDRGDIDLVSFSDEAEAMGTIDGKLNALPIAMNAPTVYWNKTLLDERGIAIPATWDEMFAAAETLAKDDIGLLSTEPQFAWFLSTAYVEQQTGRKLLDEEGNVLFTQEDIQAMLEIYSRMVEEKVICPVDLFDKTEITEERCAGVIAWTNSAESFSEAVTESGYEMVVGVLPVQPDAARSGWYYKPLAYYAVSANSEHPKEAVLLMNFLLNSKEMALEQKLERGVPMSDIARKTLVDNDLLTGLTYDAYQTMDAAVQQMELESTYFENYALVNTFAQISQDAVGDAKKAEAGAKEFYQYMKDKTYQES